MGKTIRYILFVIALEAAMILLLQEENQRTMLMGQEARLPADMAETQYIVFPLKEEAGRYRLRLENADPQGKAVLLLAAMRPFQAQVNGTEAYSYQSASPYRRLHEILLEWEDGEPLEVVLLSGQGQKWLKALVATEEACEKTSELALLVNCVSIGIHLMMLFHCLSLYFQKRSEAYLLIQAGVAFISLVSSCLTCGLAMPVSEAFYVKLQYGIDSLGPVMWGSLCILLAGQGELPGGVSWKKAAFSVASFFAVILFGNVRRMYWLSESVSWLIFAAAVWQMARAYAKKVPWMRMLGLSYVSLNGIATYSQLANIGLIPNTRAMVYFYMPQLGNLLFLLACMLIVDRRFAGKFREAELLVAELEESKRGLDRKVEERTRQLREQQKQRHTMMVNIFHDLRSPIFSAKGCAEMLETMEGEAGENIHIIREKLDFLGELTEQLFLAAKLEDGQITFTESEVDLSALCRHAGGLFGREASAGGIRFWQEIQEGVFVTGDGFRLKQALENLLQNALKYTPEGGTVSLCLGQNGKEAKMAVSDTGKGIAAEELSHVFERYYYGRHPDPGQSNGLGLSIASEIVKAHGGRITVESKQGEGTAFSVYLPLSDP